MGVCLSGSDYLLGKLYGEGEFSGGQFSSDTIVRGAIFLGDNYPQGNYPRGNHLGGNYLGGNCPGVTFSWAIVLEPFQLSRSYGQEDLTAAISFSI